jgi:hypothetical protein
MFINPIPPSDSEGTMNMIVLGVIFIGLPIVALIWKAWNG